MGEHKHNPTATAAKNGELPPKKKPMGTAESRAWVYAMCGREIDYEVDGVNLDFNHYGVVNFKTPFSAEKQLCLTCAARVCNFVENSAKMDGGADDASV